VIQAELKFLLCLHHGSYLQESLSVVPDAVILHERIHAHPGIYGVRCANQAHFSGTSHQPLYMLKYVHWQLNHPTFYFYQKKQPV